MHNSPTVLQTKVASQELLSTQSKKRPLRKSKNSNKTSSENILSVTAYCTADEYNLEDLSESLKKQGLYFESKNIDNDNDVDDMIFVHAKYNVDVKPREIFLFRDGCVVFWNVPDVERTNFLNFIKKNEVNSFDESVILEEKETINYVIHGLKAALKKDTIVLSESESTSLEQYAVSNAMALSVKLANMEATLDNFAEDIEYIEDDMKSGRKLRITSDQVFKKFGQLYSLRHTLNLSSDMLDTPDFYWDRPELEKLFQATFHSLSISKRTRILNEKLYQCIELMDLLRSHLSDKHHVRLEVMIIALIMVEVMFAFIHYIHP